MAKGKYKKWLEAESLILLEGWARDGLTDEQIAKNMGIHVATLYTWKDRYNEIDDALKKGKEVADYIVENALFKAAVGGKYEETRIEIMPNGKKKAIQITKEVPPNAGAAIFWLKNRRAEKWKDRREEVITTSISNAAISDVEDFINGLAKTNAADSVEV